MCMLPVPPAQSYHPQHCQSTLLYSWYDQWDRSLCNSWWTTSWWALSDPRGQGRYEEVFTLSAMLYTPPLDVLSHTQTPRGGGGDSNIKTPGCVCLGSRTTTPGTTTPRTTTLGTITPGAISPIGRTITPEDNYPQIRIMGVIVLGGNCPTNRGNCLQGNCPTGVMVLGGSCPGGNRH